MCILNSAKVSRCYGFTVVVVVSVAYIVLIFAGCLAADQHCTLHLPVLELPSHRSVLLHETQNKGKEKISIFVYKVKITCSVCFAKLTQVLL